MMIAEFEKLVPSVLSAVLEPIGTDRTGFLIPPYVRARTPTHIRGYRKSVLSVPSVLGELVGARA